MSFLDWCTKYVATWNSLSGTLDLTVEDCLNTPFIYELFKRKQCLLPHIGWINIDDPELAAKITKNFIEYINKINTTETT